MPLVLNIEHLILEGTPFAASESRAFRTALERELAVQTAGMELSNSESGRRVSVTAPEIPPGTPASLQAWAAASASSLISAINLPNPPHHE